MNVGLAGRWLEQEKMIYCLLTIFCIFLNCTSISAAQEFSDLKSGYSNTPVYFPQKTLRGQLRPRQHTIIASGMAARLNEFSVVRGDAVQKGQKIAVFECSYEKAEEAVALSRLDAAQTRLEVNKRLQKLNNISRLDLDLSRTEVEITKGELQKIRALLNECVIHVPFSGIVTEKFVQAYQFVAKGEPLLQLIDISTLEVEMVLPSTWLPQIKTGAAFSIHIDETNNTVNGRVDRVIGAVDPVSQTVHIIGVLSKTNSELLPGMSGKVEFQGFTPRNHND